MTRTRMAAAGAVVLLAAGLGAIPAAHYYYESSWGEGCARCHEIRQNFDYWRNSTHRKINCTECHESSIQTNLRRVKTHFFGDIPERIHFPSEDVFAMVDKCQKCHRQEFAQWSSGLHATVYSRIFTDPEHNRNRHLMDDCLRCHGMYLEGGIRDLVQPIDTKGPWRLKDASIANRPAIPCLACHSVHNNGAPLVRRADRTGRAEEIMRPSLALFDRRTNMHIPAAILPLPRMLSGSSEVKISPDQRQALCYQCHAPVFTMQVGSGDDRTPVGVHEGLSCFACHEKHGQRTRQSCADCHPRLSNCGLDVERMDTTFADKKSKHNIHFVKCADCHPKGVPLRKVTASRRSNGVAE